MTLLGLSLAWWMVRAAGRLGGQEQARRNALVGAAVLADRRLERLEVEEFLASRAVQVGADDVPPVLRSTG